MCRHVYKCLRGPSDQKDRVEEMKTWFDANTRMQIKVLKCPHCPPEKAFTHIFKDQLKKHFKTHYPPEKKHECQYCGVGIMRKDNLMKHEKYVCKKRPRGETEGGSGMPVLENSDMQD